MKLLLAGSRGYTNQEYVSSYIYNFHLQNKVSKVISGGASGIDKLGERWAIDNNVEILQMVPEWTKYGKRAGAIRNAEMIKQCDAAILFWDGVSPGTKITIYMLKRVNKPHFIIHVKIE